MPIEILMPALSPTMTEGNLAKWVKKEGDEVKPGQVMAEIETDKATMEVEAVDGGVIGKILVPEGTDHVPVNQVIALLLEPGEDKKSLESYKPKAAANQNETKDAALEKGKEAPTPAKEQKTSESKAPVAPTQTKAPSAPAASVFPDKRSKASPLAKRIAGEQGVDLSNLQGSGPGGRIVRADVENAGNASGVIRRNSNEFTTAPHNNIRKIIARRLTESKQQVPHFYLTVDCRIDKLLDTRKVLNDAANGAYKISVNDMVIKATALALKKMPSVNVSWYDDAMVQYTNVDVSVAVALEGGLVTPVIRNADQKNLGQISTEMKELAAKARAGKLRPEEMQGGGFSISNLGMYGVKDFSAIINPPQACILAVGAGEERVVATNGTIEIANIMSVTLSTDHRAVDGALGAEWLASFKRLIEEPVLMFV